MRSVLLMLMASVTQVQSSLPCPASCVVCSEDAIICNKLSSITEAPNSTKVLMLTDGLIETVDSVAFSNISSMSVLALSHNIISTIMKNAFHKLTVLQTLLLDHNRISSQSLDRSTFFRLHELETLNLGNNALRDIDGCWFQKTTALKTLLLAGNLLTSLNLSTFVLSDLRNLETLDLSDNLIVYVGRDSFRKIPHLRNLDLSRNRLQTAPDAFSYLPWLSKLNLDLNRWNCDCELHELASFLNRYIKSSGKVLYNGQRMWCASSGNPAVRTVLELTKNNCVPANRDVREELGTKSSVTPQRYIRDVVLAAVFACLGGVAITLAILAVLYRKLSKIFRPWQGKNGTHELSSPVSARWKSCEGKEVLSISYPPHNSNYQCQQPWDKESTLSDSMPDSIENHFICHNCSSATRRSSSMRKPLMQKTNHTGIQNISEGDLLNHVRTDQWENSASQSWTKDVRAQESRRDQKQIGGFKTNHFKRQHGEISQHGDLRDTPSMRMQQIALKREISNAQKQALTPKEQTHRNHSGDHALNQPEYGPEPVYQTFNCLHCHQTYGGTHTGNEEQDSIFRNYKYYTLSRGDKRSNMALYPDTLNSDPSHLGCQSQSHAKLQKSTIFDLSLGHGLTVHKEEQEGPYRISRTKMSKTLEQKSSLRPGRESTNGNRISAHRQLKSSLQDNRKLKIKLNLNPVRRCQVLPMSSSGREHKGATKTSKKVKKDKSYNNRVKKDIESYSEQEPRKDRSTKKSSCGAGTSGQCETQGLKSSSKKSVRKSKNSNMLAESTGGTAVTQPLSVVNTTDSYQIRSPDGNLPVSIIKGTKSKKTPQNSVQVEGSNEHEAQSLQASVQKSVPLFQSSDLLTESTDTAVMQPFSTETTTNLDQPVSSLKDTDTTSLMQSSDCFAECTDTSKTQSLSAVTTILHQQATNQDLSLFMSTLEDRDFKKTRSTNQFPGAEGTNAQFVLQSSQTSVQKSSEDLNSDLLVDITDTAVPQSLSMGNTRNPQQAANGDSIHPVSTSEDTTSPQNGEDLCRDTTTPTS